MTNNQTTVRVVSWNIDRPGQHRMTSRISALVEELRPDIALLQEVSNANATMLEEAFGRTNVALGGALYANSRDRSAAIVCASSATPVARPGLLAGHCAPERGVTWAVEVGKRSLSVASVHQVAGSDRKKWGPAKKRQAFDAVVAWAGEHGSCALFGIDANSPETDHPDVQCNRYFPVVGGFDQHEHLLHDPNRAPHAHRDAYRRYLAEHNPARLAEIARNRPSGPLAVSHVNRGNPRRFDFIFASSDLEPIDVEYREDLRAGANEHAPVIATFTLPQN